MLKCDGSVFIAHENCPGTYAKQHRAGISLLERLCRERGVQPAGISVTPTGKPYFDPPCGLHFSISHTGEHVFCAIAPIPIGLDAEAGAVSEAIARRYLLPYLPKRAQNTPAEGAHSALAEDDFSLDRAVAWTRRESLGKLTGEGFFVSDVSCCWKTVFYDAIPVTVAAAQAFSVAAEWSDSFRQYFQEKNYE